MGKLADLIQRATRPAIAPLGFGTARSKPSPTMIVVAVIGAKWKDAVGKATSSGASAVLLTGGPGCGKSRLARRHCELALDGGWNDPWLAGTIDLGELPDSNTIGIAAATRIFEPLMKCPGPVLIVVDYAERQATYIEAILKAATQADRGQHQFRVLLVTRSEGDWWELLRAKFDGNLPEDDPFEGAPHIALASLTQGDEAHGIEYQRSFAAFQKILSGNEDAAHPAPPPPASGYGHLTLENPTGS